MGQHHDDDPTDVVSDSGSFALLTPLTGQASIWLWHGRWFAAAIRAGRAAFWEWTSPRVLHVAKKLAGVADLLVRIVEASLEANSADNTSNFVPTVEDITGLVETASQLSPWRPDFITDIHETAAALRKRGVHGGEDFARFAHNRERWKFPCSKSERNVVLFLTRGLAMSAHF